jgi:prevent-host-death family protein
MQVNLHDAKTHLSRYVDQALAREKVVIARAGKPLVRLVPFQTQPAPRLGGFLRGQAILTADLKADFKAEIEEMFHGCGSKNPTRKLRAASGLQRGQPLGGGDQGLPRS